MSGGEDGTSAAGSWWELRVSADPEAVEAVSEILARACAGGVAVEAPFELLDEGLAVRIDGARPATVRGYVSGLDAGAARAAVAQVERELGHLQAFGLLPIGDVQTRVVHEEDWAEAWKQHFPVLRVGRRIVIRPTWREHDPAPGDVVISLDPGMAFGTGLHSTTRLCLAGIEGWAHEGLLAGATVLDVGCGSGILGICAGLLEAREVLGLDTDPLAVAASQANAARNELAGTFDARRGSLPLAEPRQFDLVLANLVAGVLLELATDLGDVLRPGGRLLASGILVDREGEVSGAFESAGLRVIGRLAEGDWVALQAERAPA
ncbi:MAG TPA: 50S ribosomal protein L11 methyltransferase [Candidatus Limnocylindria bacterium]|nr:50S ribosomal protein L11 methyltransferase [Candidatus Limnocylindria bacterium]